MNICVIGIGYVGLTIAGCLSDIGHNVNCFDIDKNKIDLILKNKNPIYEPKLDKLIKNNIKNKRLNFLNSIKEAVDNTEICFIAVGTPSKKNGGADIKNHLAVIKQVAQNIKDYTVIINKSTVPIGYTKSLKKTIKELTNIDFDIVSNPEFLRQGSAVDDFINPQRIVIGTNSKKAVKLIKKLYEPLNIPDKKFIITDENTAEMIKYASNAYLAMKISFINEIALLCEKTGANILDIQKGIGLDDRIGSKFLNSGIGYGGSCFPKDVDAIINIAKKYKTDLKIIKSVRDVNENQKKQFVLKILKYYNNKVKGKTFAVWGLSYKPNTNDLRKAPSIDVINQLLKRKAKITAYDPKAIGKAKEIFKDKITYAKSKEEAIQNSNALICFSEWKEFSNPDFEQLSLILKDKTVFDARNQFINKNIEKYNLNYIYIGKNEQKN